MGRTWLSIRVDLVGGGGRDLWPRPGRILAAARSHTFAQLATAIDDAFARWDRAHLHQFEFADGRRVGRPDWEDDDPKLLDGRRLTLGTLRGGDQFVYVFDLGDCWAHLCTVAPHRIDPAHHARHPARAATSVLGLGRHSRPVRSPVGWRRRRDPDAARS